MEPQAQAPPDQPQSPHSPPSHPSQASQPAAATAQPGSGNGAHPDFGKPPAPAGEARPAPVWVDPAEWSRTQETIRTLQAERDERAKREHEAENERLKSLQDVKQYEEALRKRDERSAQREKELLDKIAKQDRVWLDKERASVIDTILAGRKFTGTDPKATAAQVRRLLESEIEAIMGADGTPVVRDRQTLRPAADFLNERLESPEFGIFFVAEHRGGAGTDGARPAAATPKNPVDRNAAFAETFLRQREEARNARF